MTRYPRVGDLADHKKAAIDLWSVTRVGKINGETVVGVSDEDGHEVFPCLADHYFFTKTDHSAKLDLKKGDVVRVVPIGRKNRRLVRVCDQWASEALDDDVFDGWHCDGQGGYVTFRESDVEAIVPDPYPKED